MAIRIPIADIISRICDKTGLSSDEVQRRVKDKVSELSDYITEEGAAHIVANELGVKLFESLTGKFKISKLISGMRSVELDCKVIAKYDAKAFTTKDGREGKVGSVQVSDETGQVRCTLWGSVTDKLSEINIGDILRIKQAYAKLSNIGRVELHLNDNSEIEINPEGVTVSASESAASGVVYERKKATRKKIMQLTKNEDNVEICGFVVSVYEPRFFEIDPKSGRRVRLRGDKFYNDEGEEVKPGYSCVMNVIVDDGSENIRVVCFKNQMLNLCEIGEADLQMLRENPQNFESVKNSILGKPVRLVGKVVKNEMFDRIEFMSQLVFTADAKEELKKLE
ncbi:MAG: OB-fold nucleic acid binding domain-containing protein [Candidatus Woesearchaeota archaeon]|jgi:hypothetical protein